MWAAPAAALALAAAHAEPRSDVARTAAEMTAAAIQPRPDAFALVPEVSTLRTRHTLTGATVATPDGRTMNELAGVQLRLWMSRGRTAVAVGVGTLGYIQPSAGLDAGSPLTLAGTTPTVLVGMRYRLGSESAVFADASGARALPPDTSGGYLRTKVGMEWKPAKSRLGFDRGALGIQLDSGYRLSLRARSDGLRVYLRGQF